jgi:hypothetical protein
MELSMGQDWKAGRAAEDNVLIIYFLKTFSIGFPFANSSISLSR